MRASIGIMLTLLVLGGCNRAMGPTTAVMMERLAAPPNEAQHRDKSLAYEHTVSIALEPNALPNRMKEIAGAGDCPDAN
jgi:hypothetical protein